MKNYYMHYNDQLDDMYVILLLKWHAVTALGIKKDGYVLTSIDNAPQDVAYLTVIISSNEQVSGRSSVRQNRSSATHFSSVWNSLV